MRLFALVLAMLAAPVLAQERPPQPGLFQSLIPNPSGENGYEELVRAAEQLSTSKRWEKFDTQKATLAQKRSLLQDTGVRRALLTLEAGLKKPVASVRTTLTFSTLLPELAQFRNLGRLLAVKQYVDLADGKTREAIQTTRLGLRFARVIQMDTLIGGLVGVATTRVVLRPVAQHLDQFSASDCEQLYKVCVEALATPEVMASLIAGERRGIRSSLDELKQNLAKDGPKAFEGLLGPVADPPRDESEREQSELAEDLQAEYRKDPAGFSGVLDLAGRKIDDYLARQLDQATLPPWKRDRKQLDPDGSLAGRLAGAISTDFSRVQDRFSEERLLIQQLAIHAAIRRFRWENDRLPEALAVLNLGVLQFDPFTGAALEYRVDGPRYTLSSPGYPTSADDPLAVEGRRPVSLTQQ